MRYQLELKLKTSLLLISNSSWLLLGLQWQGMMMFAYGGSLVAQLWDKNYPLGRLLSTLKDPSKRLLTQFS
jgi:hypothetical protein